MAVVLMIGFLLLVWRWKPFDKGLPGVPDEDEWRREMWGGKP